MGEWARSIEENPMRSLTPGILAVALGLLTLPSHANAPDPTYDQTRDWVVAAISESAGYTHGATTVAYKDVSMDGCQLRFTTATSADSYTESDTFTVPLSSVKSVIWGTANEPERGYVIFTAQAPIAFTRQLISHAIDGQEQNRHAPTAIAATTTIAYVEFGKPGANYADLASHLRAAIVRAADLCQIRVAAK